MLTVFHNRGVLAVIQIVRAMCIGKSTKERMPERTFVIPPRADRVISLMAVRHRRVISIVQVMSAMSECTKLTHSGNNFLMSPPLAGRRCSFIMVRHMVIRSTIKVMSAMSEGTEDQKHNDLVAGHVRVRNTTGTTRTTPTNMLPTAIINKRYHVTRQKAVLHGPANLEISVTAVRHDVRVEDM